MTRLDIHPDDAMRDAVPLKPTDRLVFITTHVESSDAMTWPSFAFIDLYVPELDAVEIRHGPAAS
jgi:hypothetical protein